MKGWLWLCGAVFVTWMLLNYRQNERYKDISNTVIDAAAYPNGWQSTREQKAQNPTPPTINMPSLSRDVYEERQDEAEGEGEYGTFKGYNCTVDCSGHEAGYEWAEEEGITDPSECNGNSWSFIEGCEAFANGE
jgi:hypothetical protein